MDGIEVSQRLWADPTSAAIPQSAVPADRRQSYSLLPPVNDLLCKPFDLVEKVSRSRTVWGNASTVSSTTPALGSDGARPRVRSSTFRSPRRSFSAGTSR
jgi:hypothetical protein